MLEGSIYVTTDAVIAYVHAVADLFVVVGLTIIVYSLDDVFVDVSYWAMKLSGMLRNHRENLTDEALSAAPMRPIAIMVPAWRESDVIFDMLTTNISNCAYADYVFFVGAYANDPDTRNEVLRAAELHPEHVRLVVVPRNGPTTKADCLNAIIADIHKFELDNKIEFVGVVLHDSEDVIHPLEFALFNHWVDEIDFIQLPVFSFSRALHHLVAGTYMDEFAEFHTKDLFVREKFTGIIPCAGVAACYSAKAIRALTAFQDEAFDTSALTEDYDISFRIKRLGLSSAFIRNDVSYAIDTAGDSRTLCKLPQRLPIAVRENFPDDFRAAYRQRARWILGIAFQGAGNLGWGETMLEKIFFLRDRKGVASGVIAITGYFLAFNAIVIALFSRFSDDWRVAAYALLTPTLQWIFFINVILLLNRLFQRMLFTTRIYGMAQGLAAAPRVVASNLVNFCAALRALYVFLWRHKIRGQRLSWDKTSHSIPERELRQVKSV